MGRVNEKLYSDTLKKTRWGNIRIRKGYSIDFLNAPDGITLNGYQIVGCEDNKPYVLDIVDDFDNELKCKRNGFGPDFVIHRILDANGQVVFQRPKENKTDLLVSKSEIFQHLSYLYGIAPERIILDIPIGSGSSISVKYR